MKNVILLLLASVSFQLAASGKKSANTEPKNGNTICNRLLGLGIPLPKESPNLSQVQRVHSLLEGLTAEQRRDLFATLKDADLSQLAQQIRTGDVPAGTRAQLDSNPGLEIVILDLADLDDVFHGIFQLDNAEATLVRALKVANQALSAPKSTTDNLTQAFALAPRLNRTLNNAMINLAKQATMEYEGAKFGRSTWQMFLYRLERFFFPSYTKVKAIVDFIQLHERQLSSIQMVDRLIINIGLAQAVGLKLTESEYQNLVMQLINSPEEIQSIETSIRNVLGKKQFQYGPGVEIGHFDIPRSAALAVQQDPRWISESFDQMNLQGLESLNDQLNSARLRQGKGKRQAQDFDTLELQLYADAYMRRMSLFHDVYFTTTRETSNESYTVEESYTVQVPNGKDANGNTTYRTETHYRDRTVYPSFENILSGRFDRGDRGVSGLNDIVNRTRNLVATEEKFRTAIENAENLVGTVLEGYSEAVMKGVNRDAFLEGMSQTTQYLEALEQMQKDYVNWTDVQILRQYNQDKPSNFRKRNEAMLKRIIAVKRLIQQIHELLTRNQIQLTPSYDLFDYTNWLARLKSYRNWNYGRKAAAGMALLSAGGAYAGIPEFQYMVDSWGRDVVSTIREALGR